MTNACIDNPQISQEAILERMGAARKFRAEDRATGAGADCRPTAWQFERSDCECRATVSFKKLSAPQLFRQCIEDGLTSASEIADELGTSKRRVSELATAAMKAGWLKKDGRDYALTGQP